MAESLLSGHRLYADIYDNKDPLFFYAVSMQRLLGGVGEHLFELFMVALAALSAYDMARMLARTGATHQRLLLIAVPLLVTGGAWVPGYPQLPATAFSLLTCSLFLRGKMAFAGACIGIVALTRLIMFPVPIAFCLAHECVLWNGKRSWGRFRQLIIGFTAVVMLMIYILLARHELPGYLQAQHNNFLYSNSVLVDNSNLRNAFASHLRTIFLGPPHQLILLVSAMASMLFSGYVATRTCEETKIKAFLVGTLATYLLSIMVLGLTGIWWHHLQLIYFSQTLMLVYVAMRLHSRTALANSLFGLAIIILAILFSGSGNLRHYVASPRQAMAQMSSITQESSEAKAFRAVYPQGAGYARLGQNSNVIPHAAPKDKLLCPEFAQYFFYSPERLRHILDCAKSAPVLVVDSSFSPYAKPADWWPRESQKQSMLKNWNDFVAAGEKIIDAHYSCRKHGNVRICESVAR